MCVCVCVRACVCVCVSVPAAEAIAPSGITWHDMDPICLVRSSTFIWQL